MAIVFMSEIGTCIIKVLDVYYYQTMNGTLLSGCLFYSSIFTFYIIAHCSRLFAKFTVYSRVPL